MKKKIVIIVGARPQFIKAAVLSHAIKEHNLALGFESVEEIIVHTGQHYDANMSDIFFEEMGITSPQYNLGIHGVSHGAMTGQMLEKIEEVLQKEKPDWVVTYGDTNSTLAGALASVKLHIPTAHIEAGLRSFNRKMPEEINRILTDQCSDLLFTPSNIATAHLKKEGFSDEKISQVGDVMYDAALYYRKKMEKKGELLTKLGLSSKSYVLTTVHRAENTDDIDRLNSIFNALIEISKKIPVVLPLHPRTESILKKIGKLDEVKQNLKVIDPVGYLEIIELESSAKVILTDSGGVQKEAFFFQVPAIILRNETEWVELVKKGYAYLVGADYNKIIEAFDKVCGNELIDWGEPLYGTGNASKEILKALV